jgi:hypothetical protein
MYLFRKIINNNNNNEMEESKKLTRVFVFVSVGSFLCTVLRNIKYIIQHNYIEKKIEFITQFQYIEEINYILEAFAHST